MPFVARLSEEPRLDEIQTALREAAVYAYGVQKRIRDNGSATDQDRLDARSAIDFINDFDPIAQVLEARNRQVLDSAGPGAATLPLVENPGQRSFGEMFVESDRYSQRGRLDFGATHLEIEMGGSLFANNGADWRSMGEAQARTLVDSGTTDGTAGDAGFFRPVAQSAIPPIPFRQRFFVRDVISVQGTGLASIPYIREYDPTAYELGASAVEEAGEKPEVTLVFEQDDAPVRKIAAWVPATTEILDDAPTLRGYIDTRLAYMLALREERDILTGDGNSGRLKGILNFTGVQTQTSVTDVPQTIAAAIGKVENVEGEADGIAMNPVKFWAGVATRSANQFDGQGYGAGGGAPFNAPTGTLWGLPVIRTRSLATTKCVVGSWRLGATLFDRMRTTIRVGNQHSTYFIENKVAILAEERVALAVHRPDFFVDVTLP